MLFITKQNGWKLIKSTNILKGNKQNYSILEGKYMFKIVILCCVDKQDLWHNLDATLSPALPLDFIQLE